MLLSLELLKPILEAINNASEVLQSCTIDLLTADKENTALKNELKRLRSDNEWMAAVKRAEKVAKLIEVDAELPAERPRKISKRSSSIIFY